MTTDPLLDTFHREAEELLEMLEEGLLELETASEPAEIIDRLFRAAHTLKGNAGMVGFSEFVRLTHVAENVLDRLRSRTLEVNEGVISAIFSGLDALKVAADNFSRGRAFEATAAYDEAIAELTQLCDMEHLEAGETRERVLDIRVYFRPEYWRGGDGLSSFLDDIALLGQVTNPRVLVDRMPPELSSPDALLGIGARLRTTSGPMGVLGLCVLSVDEENITITDVEEDLLPAPVVAAPARDIGQEEEPAPGTPPPAQRRAPSTPPRAPQAARTSGSTIRVDSEKLDHLLDSVGELVIGIAQASAHSRRLPALSVVHERLEGLSRDLQEQVMGLRMLPVHDLFERFRRPIRDLGKELDKPVEFTTLGTTTQVDQKVIDALADPR